MPRRWSRPLQSVRVRITLAAVLVTAVAVGAAGWLIVTSFEDAQVREVRDNAEAYLDRIVARLEQGQDPQEAVTAAVGTLRPPGPATVTDVAGRVVATSAPEPVEGEDDGEVGAEEGTGQDDRSPSGDEDVVAAPVENLTRVVANPGGDLTVTVMAPVDEVARNVEFLTRRLAIGLPALVLVVGVIAWMLVGRALRPVEAIRAEVEGITGSTIHRRVPEPPTSDEVGRLARTMNTMLGRLETAAVQQRRFVSDASHELRSPVAVIRAGLEVARDRTDPATWPALVDSLLAEESRLEALLDDLLLLAAYDENGTSPAPTRPVDLTALTLAEAQRPRRVPVDADAAGPAVLVAGAPDQLARALSNLVDNAARHATSVVQVSLSHDRTTAHLVVDDDGPGVPPADRERIFERFTRLDDGRARHEGGTGLGLAVVHSVITHHHGQVEVEASPLGGARFTTHLPTIPH